jgi:5-methyltetrahydrofolate--homocysteine methyltransferase
VDSGIDLKRIINDSLNSAMDIVGERFAENEIYVPEMLVFATTMKRGLDIIKPLLQSGETENRGTIVVWSIFYALSAMNLKSPLMIKAFVS